MHFLLQKQAGGGFVERKIITPPLRFRGSGVVFFHPKGGGFYSPTGGTPPKNLLPALRAGDEKFKKSKSLEQQIISIYEQHLNKDDTLIVLNITKVPFKQHKKDKVVLEYIQQCIGGSIHKSGNNAFQYYSGSSNNLKI